ncbi:MAG TPA: hypothetical protein VFP98_08470 [Candidatus Polarisedimenticolia bacterium]|nr:hypothetical protein [Candidatus Polarisedimenticolia bacterium]
MGSSRFLSFLCLVLAPALAAAQDVTAAFSDDATEDTAGVFLSVNEYAPRLVNGRQPWLFQEARFLMRPFSLSTGGSGHARYRLSESPVWADQPLLEVFLPDGTPVPLPAEFPAALLPPTILVSALDTGETLLRLRGVDDGHGPPARKDEVLVRAGANPPLAGRPLAAYPWFEFVRAINQNQRLETALDPNRHAERLGLEYDVYVVRHKTPADWAQDPTLDDLTKRVERVAVVGPSIQQNVVVPWRQLRADQTEALGAPYDVVYDFGHDGTLDPGDLIDGFHFREAGFYVLEDTTLDGPLAVAKFEFDDPNLFYTEGFDGGSTRRMRSRGLVYYPNPLPAGKLPLVTFSHGNTGIQTSYQGYQHLQRLLASHGFITASFDMFPAHVSLGIRWRGWLTNKNTERLILQTKLKDESGNPYPPMGDGILDEKVDPARLVTVGHSRGGEGVIFQYNQVANPDIPGIRPPNGTLQGFDANSFQGISTFAQTTFYSAADGSKTDGRDFLMFFGSADDDVCGCTSGVLPTVHYNRARGDKAMLYLYGAGHGYFNQLWSCTCSGPFFMTRPDVEAITKGYLFPWVMLVTYDNVPALDLFTRSPSVFRPIGTEFIGPEKRIINLWRDGKTRGNFVLEDYQKNENDPFLSSSGQPVTFTVLNLFEGLFLDTNPAGGWSSTEPDGGFWWQTNGAIWDYNGTAFDYVQTLDPAEQDLSDDVWLSFITCQQANHVDNKRNAGERHFSVTLVDVNGNRSSINLQAYGATEEPYLRSNGWGSPFKTYRLRLSDFETDASGIDLRAIREVRLEFGVNFGSKRARLGFDDLEIVKGFGR